MNDGTECWFRDDLPALRLFDAIPLFVYICFAVFLLAFAWFKLRSLIMPQRTRRQLLGRMVRPLSVALVEPLSRSSWCCFTRSDRVDSIHCGLLQAH